MKLTTIHPGLVCGTPMDTHYGSSLEVIERLWSGKDPMSPKIWMPIVDLEDVSRLHIAAMERDDIIGKRILATDDTMTFPEVAQVIKDLMPNRKIATKTAPKLLLQILALFDKDLQTILPQVDREVLVDTSVTENMLGFSFVPGATAIEKSATFVNAHKG